MNISVLINRETIVSVLGACRVYVMNAAACLHARVMIKIRLFKCDKSPKTASRPFERSVVFNVGVKSERIRPGCRENNKLL